MIVGQEEVWQQLAGKWATCGTGQKPRAMEAPSTSSGSAFCTVKSSPLTFALNVWSKCASVMAPNGANAPPPALALVDRCVLSGPTTGTMAPIAHHQKRPRALIHCHQLAHSDVDPQLVHIEFGRLARSEKIRFLIDLNEYNSIYRRLYAPDCMVTGSLGADPGEVVTHEPCMPRERTSHVGQHGLRGGGV